MTPKSGFCVGGIFTLADIVVVSTVEYLALRFEEYEFNEKCPKLLQFVDEHKNRPSFKNTRPQPQKLNKDVVWKIVIFENVLEIYRNALGLN